MVELVVALDATLRHRHPLPARGAPPKVGRSSPAGCVIVVAILVAEPALTVQLDGPFALVTVRKNSITCSVRKLAVVGCKMSSAVYRDKFFASTARTKNAVFVHIPELIFKPQL